MFRKFGLGQCLELWLRLISAVEFSVRCVWRLLEASDNIGSDNVLRCPLMFNLDKFNSL